jgi:hypothetical protein
MIFIVGLLFIIISLFILAYVIFSMVNHRAVAGWASIILSLWFIGGCILIALSVIGEYIGKIYLEVKDRPRYIIDKKIL